MSRFDYSGPVKTNVKSGSKKPSRAAQMAKRTAGDPAGKAARPQWHKDAAARTRAGAKSAPTSAQLMMHTPARALRAPAASVPKPKELSAPRARVSKPKAKPAAQGRQRGFLRRIFS